MLERREVAGHAISGGPEVVIVQVEVQQIDVPGWLDSGPGICLDDGASDREGGRFRVIVDVAVARPEKLAVLLIQEPPEEPGAGPGAGLGIVLRQPGALVQPLPGLQGGGLKANAGPEQVWLGPEELPDADARVSPGARRAPGSRRAGAAMARAGGGRTRAGWEARTNALPRRRSSGPTYSLAWSCSQNSGQVHSAATAHAARPGPATLPSDSTRSPSTQAWEGSRWESRVGRGGLPRSCATSTM